MTEMGRMRPLSVAMGRLRAWRRERRLARRRRVAEAVASHHGMRVLAGPFTGMIYPGLEAAGSTLAPKLLGSYEEEVHPFVERLVERRYRSVVNPGCGEGYYAVGLALRIPGAIVHAFDTDARSQRLCREMAEANGVARRVQVAGECGVTELREVIEDASLVVCDIEGAEDELLRPDLLPALRGCDLLVELHAAKGRQSTRSAIHDRFVDTHIIEVVRYRGRSPERYPSIAFLSSGDRKVAVDERRRRGREWMLLLRREGPSGQEDAACGSS